MCVSLLPASQFKALGVFICGVWAEVGGREEVVETKVAHYTFSVDLNGRR